ncbi:MAG: AtpZ/AtpI family protein [Jatrophihabitantaceae bacterium]
MADSGPPPSSQGLRWSNLLSIGTGSALVLAAGLGLGWWVDGLLKTTPVFLLTGMVLGIVGAVAFAVVQIRTVLK